MVTLKRVEKRLEAAEKWMKEFEKNTGPRAVLDNMNWLVEQCRHMGKTIDEHRQQLQMAQQQFNTNEQVLGSFLESNDLVMDWQAHAAKMQEQENAVQEQETEGVDAREQAEDGEGMGEEAPEGDQDTEQSEEN
tara:strand:- start:173 stop:574 length:402 start_codon:yes stop_codon:yes gene_type:complete